MARAFALAFALVLAPASASAGMSDWVSSFVSDGETVNVESHASAATGGQTAGSGQSVQTGSASASVSSVIHANNDGGTVEITVETEQDGQVYSETRKEDIPAGQGISISVGTSTGSLNSASSSEKKYEHVYQNNERDLDFISRIAGSASSSEATTARAESRATKLVSNIMKKLRVFFWWF